VVRRLRPYLADQHNMGMAGGSSCNKWQRSTMQLIPGIMLLWCLGCGKCLMFAIMPDSESPRTIFELLYTHLPQPPELFMMTTAATCTCSSKARALQQHPLPD
jgi:hypothetical protein